MSIPGLRGMPLGEFFRKLYRDVVEDAITDSAAQLSYYFLFSLFPFLFFLVTVSAYLPVKGAAEDLVERLAYVMPSDAIAVVRGHLDALLGETRPKLVTFGFIASLWTASRGVDALRKALNLAYGVAETRPYWRTQGLAVLVTVAGTLGWMAALAIWALGGWVGRWIAEEFALIDAFYGFWSWMRWPFTLALVMVNAGLMYWLLPNVRARFRLLTPGTVVGALLWILATWAFSQFVDHFGRFNVTYGSIGGVVVLMLWLYISGLILILGCEINAVVDSVEAPGAPALVPPRDEAAPLPPGAAKRAEPAKRLRRHLRRLLRREHA